MVTRANITGDTNMAGLSKRGGIWYITWRDSRGLVRRVTTGTADRAVAEHIKRQKEIELRVERHDPTARWRKVPLSDHAKDYRAQQLASGTTQKQADQVHSRIRRIIAAVKARQVSDLTVATVTKAISQMRQVPQSPKRKPENYPLISLRTRNFYVRAIKQLTAWMLRERRITDDPLQQLAMWKRVQTDLRHERRSLRDEEFRQLIAAAEASAETIDGLSGPERSFLYLMARLTGLRKSELGSLTADSFHLDDENPFVILEATYSKHREEDCVLLHSALVPLLRNRLEKLPEGEPLFPLLSQRKTHKMMQVDLAAAGVPYRATDGRFADFHALRHSFITRAWESASADVVMALARHRSLQMTMNYTDVDQSDRVRAIKAMPSPLEDSSGEGVDSVMDSKPLSKRPRR